MMGQQKTPIDLLFKDSWSSLSHTFIEWPLFLSSIETDCVNWSVQRYQLVCGKVQIAAMKISSQVFSPGHQRRKWYSTRSVEYQGTTAEGRLQEGLDNKCRVRKGTGSQTDVILNKEARADNGFYRGLWSCHGSFWSLRSTEYSCPICTNGYVCWGFLGIRLGTESYLSLRPLWICFRHNWLHKKLGMFSKSAVCALLVHSHFVHFSVKSRRPGRRHVISSRGLNPAETRADPRM